MFEMPWPAAERRRRAAELLDAVGLSQRLDHLPPKTLGGRTPAGGGCPKPGQRTRLLLADEPTGNLDSVNAQRIMELLRKSTRQRGMTVVIVTHDAQIGAYAHRTLQMLDGRIVSGAGPVLAR